MMRRLGVWPIDLSVRVIVGPFSKAKMLLDHTMLRVSCEICRHVRERDSERSFLSEMMNSRQFRSFSTMVVAWRENRGKREVLSWRGVT